jgi:hypothetical protein
MLFKNSFRTSKGTPHFTITKINWLTLFKFKVFYKIKIEGQEVMLSVGGHTTQAVLAQTCMFFYSLSV